jgi:4-hydroxybenzoate polyprenyltransferase
MTQKKTSLTGLERHLLDSHISQRAKITAYFTGNFLAVFMASAVSFRAVVFFSAYIFGIWLYSHKLKRITFVGNLVSASLWLLRHFLRCLCIIKI